MKLRADVRYVTQNDFVLAVGADKEQYSFRVSKIEGYAGEDIEQIGLKVGAHVDLSVEEGQVVEAMIAR